MDANGLMTIGAGLAVGLAGLGVGIGQGMCSRGALEAIGRNPEAESKIKSTMLLGLGMTESAAIYGLLISLIILFVFAA